MHQIATSELYRAPVHEVAKMPFRHAIIAMVMLEAQQRKIARLKADQARRAYLDRRR